MTHAAGARALHYHVTIRVSAPLCGTWWRRRGRGEIARDMLGVGRACGVAVCRGVRQHDHLVHGKGCGRAIFNTETFRS